MCLHRLKHVRNGFVEALRIKSNLYVSEPKDKELIRPGHVYLAPANYHLYIETPEYFSLGVEEPVNHSRPSIDLTFISAARTLQDNCIGILLSGANKDGAWGMSMMKKAGATIMVQSPEECQVKTMTTAAIKYTNVDYIFTTDQIINFLIRLTR